MLYSVNHFKLHFSLKKLFGNTQGYEQFGVLNALPKIQKCQIEFCKNMVETRFAVWLGSENFVNFPEICTTHFLQNLLQITCFWISISFGSNGRFQNFKEKYKNKLKSLRTYRYLWQYDFRWGMVSYDNESRAIPGESTFFI